MLPDDNIVVLQPIFGETANEIEAVNMHGSFPPSRPTPAPGNPSGEPARPGFAPG